MGGRTAALEAINSLLSAQKIGVLDAAEIVTAVEQGDSRLKDWAKVMRNRYHL